MTSIESTEISQSDPPTHGGTQLTEITAETKKTLVSRAVTLEVKQRISL